MVAFLLSQVQELFLVALAELSSFQALICGRLPMWEAFGS